MRNPLEDLGAKFSRDRNFFFDSIIIHEIIFDETNDVTLFCTVPYFGQDYSANFGLTFEQLDFVIRHTNPAGKDIAQAIAEKLGGDIEIPSVIEIDLLYGQPLEVTNCIFDTFLYDFSDDDKFPDQDDEDDENLNSGEEGFGPEDFDNDAENEEGFSGEDDDDDDDDDDDENSVGESYAFLIADVFLKPGKE